MADPPRPPRQPPPLPQLPLRRVPPEPLPEPFQDLTLEERAADTQRSRPRRDELPPPALDPLTETTAQLLRRELALVRETLPTLPALPALSIPPGSVRTRSRATVAALVAGKYGAAVTLGGPTVARIIAKAWPASAPVILPLLEALGL